MGEQPPVMPYAPKPKTQPPFFTKLTLAAFFMAFIALMFPDGNGDLAPELLILTAPAFILAWVDFLRPAVKPLRTRLVGILVVAAVSMVFIKNMADVLWER